MRSVISGNRKKRTSIFGASEEDGSSNSSSLLFEDDGGWDVLATKKKQASESEVVGKVNLFDGASSGNGLFGQQPAAAAAGISSSETPKHDAILDAVRKRVNGDEERLKVGRVSSVVCLCMGLVKNN